MSDNMPIEGRFGRRARRLNADSRQMSLDLPPVLAPQPAIGPRPVPRRLPTLIEVRDSLREMLRTRMDPSLFVTMFGAVTVGIVAVFSASFPYASRPMSVGGKDDPYVYLRQQAFYAAGGLVLTIITSYIRPSTIRKYAWVALAASLVLMGYCVGLNQAQNGASAYLGERGQPSEFGKLAYLLYLCSLLVDGADFFRDKRRLAWAFGTMSIMLVLLVLQNDLGMAMLVVGMTFIVLFLSGTQEWFIGLVGSGLAGLAGLGLMIDGGHHFSRVTSRIAAWVHPEEHLDGSGGHIANMLATTSRGSLVGEGLGMCGDKWKGLFAPHTDAIFCVIAGELGIWGAAALLGLLATIPVLCFRIALRSRDRLGWLFASTIGASLGLQTLINVAVATNSIPCTGLTLPFISAGGSSLVASMIAIGVVLSVGRYGRPEEAVSR